jgi:hypothetical protein
MLQSALKLCKCRPAIQLAVTIVMSTIVSYLVKVTCEYQMLIAEYDSMPTLVGAGYAKAAGNWKRPNYEVRLY